MLDGIRAGHELNQPADAILLLRYHGRACVADHVVRVVSEADRLARRYGIDADAACIAAWLHDLSLVLPYADMLRAAEEANLEILPEERQAPGILHGKLSSYLARKLFSVADPAILGAIECHTTLRANPSPIAEANAGDPPLVSCGLYIFHELSVRPPLLRHRGGCWRLTA